jgi:hypothetical protein
MRPKHVTREDAPETEVARRRKLDGTLGALDSYFHGNLGAKVNNVDLSTKH